jgi:plastocyanin
MTSADISFSTTHTITTSGFAFSPSSITITLGDTVNFVLASIHNAREVSQATWNGNGTTSNGGFDLPFGGGKVVLTQAGIHYYVCVPHASGGMKGTITVNPATGIEPDNGTIPANFSLMQNYPNPFNPETVISFSLPNRSYTSLKIFDVLGNEVAVLLVGDLSAGKYSYKWNAASFTSGVYFYRLETDSFIETKKLILLK